MRLFLFAISVISLSACGANDDVEEYQPSEIEISGRMCAEQGNTIEQCSLVCSKMGVAKDDCWKGYFEAKEDENQTSV